MKALIPKIFLKSMSSATFFARFADTETYLKQIFGNTIDMVESINKVALSISLF